MRELTPWAEILRMCPPQDITADGIFELGMILLLFAAIVFGVKKIRK